MNQQAARLQSFQVFTQSIQENKQAIISLSEYTINTLDETALVTLSCLFKNLKLVLTNSPLVTFSKTMHFYLPNLVTPIDRRYTCDFFNIYPNATSSNLEDFQLTIFIDLLKAFNKFSKTYNLFNLVETSSDWNLNLSKIIDNMIIGHKYLRKIVLLMCGNNKLNHAAKAELLYTSLRFKRSLQYAKTLTQPENIYILSAKYFLLPLNKKIEPYDVSLYEMEDLSVKLWAKKVLFFLKKSTDMETNTYIFLTDNLYSKYIFPRLAVYELPLNDMTHEQQLKYIKKQLGETE